MTLKLTLAGLVLVSGTFLTAAALTRPHSQAGVDMPQTSRTPVVVELFTSEGCSTCPPADALLAQLADEKFGNTVQLIAMEEHVDYWDDQGWVDPFSSRDWTLRQYAYAGVLGNKNAYTPQMVIDGTTEFVGNHTGQARESILKAASNAKIPVSLVHSNPNGAAAVELSAKVGKLNETAKGNAAEVWLAITETALRSAVKRGENAGKDLQHAAVVRSMHKIGEAKGGSEMAFTGETKVSLQKEWNRANLKAVLFVQEKKSRRILGAAEIRIAE